MKTWQSSFAFGAGLGAAFVLGQLLPRPAGAGGEALPRFGEPVLAAQGRGPINAPPAPPTTGPGSQPPAPQVVYSEESGNSAAANGFLAVTGSYGVGTSVLYVVDTVRRQLAVYEARGGSTEQRRIVLVGARRIDLDLQLEGYNDRSEYEYRRLKDLFQNRGGNDQDVKTGLEPGPQDKK